MSDQSPYSIVVNTINELKTAVSNAFQRIRCDSQLLKSMSSRTWRKIQFCAENKGSHTDLVNV